MGLLNSALCSPAGCQLVCLLSGVGQFVYSLFVCAFSFLGAEHVVDERRSFAMPSNSPVGLSL